MSWRSWVVGLLVLALCGCGRRRGDDDDDDDGGEGEGEGEGEPEEPPDGAVTGLVAEQGVPFDPDLEFYPGPQALIASGHPQLVAHANRDGSIEVAWLDSTSPQIVLTNLRPTGEGWEVAWHLPLATIHRLAGYTRDGDGHRYWVTTIAEDELQFSTTPTGEHRDGIARLHAADASGAELYATDLHASTIDFADPLVAPMSFGTGRLAVGGGRAGITFSCLTEYDPGVTSRHQRQCFFQVDATTGAEIDHVPGPGHSFEQRLLFDGERFVSLILGDAGLRGLGLAAFGPSTAYSNRVAFAIKGGDATTGGAYQNTFTRAGQVVATPDGYAVLFATENDPTYTGDMVIASRNLALVHVVPDFDTVAVDSNFYHVQIVDTATENPEAVDFDVQIVDYWGGEYDGLNRGIVWLTADADRARAHVESPKLVRLSDGRLLALWEKWTLQAPVATWAMVIDEWGRVLEPAREIGRARLYRGDDAVSLGDRAAWVVGRAEPPALILHTVGADLQLETFELP